MRVCLLVFTLLCFSPLYAGEQLSVLFVNPSVKTDLFWQKVSKVLHAAAQQHDVNLSSIYGGGNRHIQLAELKHYLQYQTKPDYAILMNYPGGASQSMALLEQHKVKFVTLEETIVGTERDQVGLPQQRYKHWLGEVFHDNFEAGAQLGKVLLSSAIIEQETPHFVAINGHYGSESDTRSNGLLDFLDRQNIALKQIVYANWSKQEAAVKVRRLLQRYPDTNVIWCASDLMAQGALEVVSGRTDKAYFIGGIDWLDENLALIEQQKLTASVGGHFMMGAWALVSLVDHHNGNPYWQNHHAIEFKLGVITQHNIASFNWLRNIKDWSTVPFKAFLLQNTNQTEYMFDFDTLHAHITAQSKTSSEIKRANNQP